MADVNELSFKDNIRLEVDKLLAEKFPKGTSPALIGTVKELIFRSYVEGYMHEVNISRRIHSDEYNSSERVYIEVLSSLKVE